MSLEDASEGARAPVDLSATALGVAFSAARGDKRATAELLALVAPAVMRAVRMVLGTHGSERDDVNQQAMLNVVRGLASFRGDCHPAGWAARIAVHTAWSARRSAREARLSYHDPDDLAALSSSPRASDGELAAHRKHLLRDILRQLPAEQAEVLALHVVLGHSLPEVAAITSTPLNTVKSRLRLAKELLRRRLTDGGPGEETGGS